MVLLFTLVAVLGLTTFIQCGKWHDSLTLWNSVLEQNPASAIAYNNRGTQQPTNELALRDYNRCIELDPNFIEAYFNRANLYTKLGQYDLAIKDYSKCIALDPTDAQAYLLRSRSYYLIGDIEAAIQDAVGAKSMGYKVDEQYLSQLSREDRP